MTTSDKNNQAGRLRIAIIDPCYHKKGGHHHGINRELVRYLDWCEPKVYTDSRIETNEVVAGYPSSSNLQPVFTDLGYISPEHYSTVSTFCEQARAFSRQLKPLSADVVVGHTLLHFHLYGLGLYLTGQPPTQVIVSLMFSPFEGLRSEPNEALDFCFTSIALRSLNDAALSRGHRITVGITSEYHWELMEKFRKSHPFLAFTRSPWLVGAHNHGIPVDIKPSSIQGQRDTPRHTILLYLGDAKPDKGIETVRELLRWLVEQPLDVLSIAAQRIKIEIHVTYCDDWLLPCVDDIRDICSRAPNLIIFSSKHYSSKDYFAILSSANTIVWLYDPQNYRYRTSGIFYDALSLHCSQQSDHRCPHFVVSQGSWMQKEFQLLGFAPTTIDLSSSHWKQDLWHTLVASAEGSVPLSAPSKDLLAAYCGQSWNHWLTQSLGLTEQKLLDQISQIDCERRPLIVISTDYPHFTRLSGPTGFVQYLEGALHFKTRLGKSQEYDWIRALTGLKSATDDALRLEKELMNVLIERPADIVCVDGEHAGSLLALALRDQQLHPDTQIFAWFHQPSTILASDIIEKATFPADSIHPICISPCQTEFFEEHLEVSSSKVTVIPHGVHAELISLGHQGVVAKNVGNTKISNRPIKLVTVGNWLRDRALIFKAAEACPEYEFVWVSTGMILASHEQTHASTLSNLKITTSGLSNEELHQHYIAADYLFQPLISGTANNAIIEAMAFGIPIITKKLVSTEYYTDGRALFYFDDDNAIELLKSLRGLARQDYLHISQSLSKRVTDFEWAKIASLFAHSMSLAKGGAG